VFNRIVIAAVCLVGPSWATASLAQPCSPTSVFPQCGIMLPGAGDTHTPAQGPAATEYRVEVRDCLNQPVPGINVYLDASGAPDIRISDLQEPGSFVDCQRMRIYRVTGGDGSATFHIRGAGRNSLPSGGIGPGGIHQVILVAGSSQIGLITLATPDQNGAGVGGTVVNGIDAGDGAFLRYDILNYNLPGQAGRSDLNCSGGADAADGAVFRDFLFNDSVSRTPQTTTYCPI